MTTLLATWREPGETAVKTAWQRRLAQGSLLDCVESGLAACEEDERFILIGRGSLPNSDGQVELDASIMDGADLSAGAVCAVQDICPVISLARRVKERTPHVMIAGSQARQFAIDQGFEVRSLMTEENCRRYEEWRNSPEHRFTHIEHAVAKPRDTVTMLGWESSGHVVAASSTSGWAWKQPGRVGDSPIIGAGIYADNDAGCAGATGMGEELWKAVASFRTVQAMGGGLSAQEACLETVAHMKRRQPLASQEPCVVFAMRTDGDFGAATTKDDFELWICRDGSTEMRVFSA